MVAWWPITCPQTVTLKGSSVALWWMQALLAEGSMFDIMEAFACTNICMLLQEGGMMSQDRGLL